MKIPTRKVICSITCYECDLIKNIYDDDTIQDIEDISDIHSDMCDSKILLNFNYTTIHVRTSNKKGI